MRPRLADISGERIANPMTCLRVYPYGKLTTGILVSIYMYKKVRFLYI